MTVRNAQQVPFVSQFMWRRFIARSAAALSEGTSVGALANPAVAPASQPDTLIAATQWPEKETVDGLPAP
jgi:hypothetical protein